MAVPAHRERKLWIFFFSIYRTEFFFSMAVPAHTERMLWFFFSIKSTIHIYIYTIYEEVPLVPVPRDGTGTCATLFLDRSRDFLQTVFFFFFFRSF
jgi:hypothetical protein